MKKKPLVSIILLSYKNYHYIYGALDSILEQDYNNIEIIISNDGSNDFDKAAIVTYFKKNKTKNIKNIVINNNKKNLGTVKNINKSIKLSKGKYLIIFAADDEIYNTNVVSKLVNVFHDLPKKELIVTSQIGMFDTTIKRLIQLFVSEKNKKKIQKLSPKKLFAEMSIQCIFPGCGTCYKRKLFEKYGYFDEKYVLVEDYSSALKLARLGLRFNYVDFISFKHRDGGISHGNNLNDSSAIKQYDLDILNILKFEVLPYTHLLNKKQKKSFMRYYKDHEWKYLYKYKYKNGTKPARRKFIKKNINIMVYSFFKNIYKELIDQIKGKKIKIFFLGLFLLTVYSLNVDYGFSILSSLGIQNLSKIPQTINLAIGFLGLILTILVAIATIYFYIKKYIIIIYEFIKFIY